MPISSTEDFEKAMQEFFQRLREIRRIIPGRASPMELDAEIKAYDASRGGEGSGERAIGGGSGVPETLLELPVLSYLLQLVPASLIPSGW